MNAIQIREWPFVYLISALSICYLRGVFIKRYLLGQVKSKMVEFVGYKYKDFDIFKILIFLLIIINFS